jgi:predicted DNA repair protein MutK
MSGLLALLDDVAAIAKVAAASVDDIAAAAAKAGAKAAGVVIDDAAVTPKYVHGFAAERELPIIWRIAKGSLWNKLAVLLPALLALNYFAPVLITPLLMLGGAYLCFEGAEKLLHAFAPHADADVEADFDTGDSAHLEEEKVAGAIKTDFILSAEIMTIALSTIPDSALWLEAVTLAIVGAAITAAVYGAVALIVKMDDIGLHMAANRKTAPARAFGRGLVLAMPKLMTFLSVVGTAAMLWVGGSIVVHGLEVTHIWAWPYTTIHHMAEIAAHAVPAAAGFVAWAVTALFDGIIGAVLGAALIPVVTKAIVPIWGKVAGKKVSHQS